MSDTDRVKKAPRWLRKGARILCWVCQREFTVRRVQGFTVSVYGRRAHSRWFTAMQIGKTWDRAKKASKL